MTHINKQGQFISDKFDLPPDYIAVKFTKRKAEFSALTTLAHFTKDKELSDDIIKRLNTLK